MEKLQTSPFIQQHPCPDPGSGVHQWVFSAALSLRGIGMTDDAEIARIVAEHATRKDTREIAEAVRNSAAFAGTVSKFSASGAKQARTGVCPKAQLNQAAVQAITKKYGGLSILRGLSPAEVHRWTSENLLDGLFPGDLLLCLARSKNSATTAPRERFRSRENAFPLLVPSPMTARVGTNKAGKKSVRCLDNTGARRFLVIEFDQGTPDHQAAALLDLGTMAPLVLVLHSGGKSLHGWFFCQGQDEKLLHRFHTYACSLGADPATWTRCQLVRMPAGVRENGARQELLFLNPTSCPGFPSVPVPEGYCPRCWGENNAAIPLHSPFPCGHKAERRAA